ncbi:MAG: hypothetical protein QF475_01995 [Candidatus Undinarchaeales archaeon]|nr:hypothetical protein [Candidatus Undinarchaeales archaeon]
MTEVDHERLEKFLAKGGSLKPPPQLWFDQDDFNRVRPRTIKSGTDVVLAMDLPSKIKRFERIRWKSDYVAILNINNQDRNMLIFNKDFDTKNWIALQKILSPVLSTKMTREEALSILIFCTSLAYSYSLNQFVFSKGVVKKMNSALGNRLQVKETNKTDTLLKQLKIKKDELKKIVLDQLQLFLEKTESNREFPVPMELFRMGRLISTRENSFVSMIKKQAERKCKNVIVDVGCFKSVFFHTLMEKQEKLLKNSCLVGLDIGGISEPVWRLYKEVKDFDEIRKVIQNAGAFRPGAEQWFRYTDIKKIPKTERNKLFVNRKYTNVILIVGKRGMYEYEHRKYRSGPGDYRKIGRIFSDEVLKNRFGMVTYRRMFKHEHNIVGNPLEFLEKYSNAFYICSERYENDQRRIRRGIGNARKVLKDWRTKEWKEEHSYFLFAERKKK